MILLLVLFTLLATLVIFLYHKQRRVFKKVEHIPGPPMLPFLGNALEFGTNSVDILRNLKRLSEKYGPVVRLCVGWKVFILLSEPKYVFQAVKYNDVSRPHEIFEDILPLLGRGLLTIAGETWTRHRRIMNRSFSAKHLEKYTNTINKNADKLVHNLRRMAGPNSVDITEEIFSCSLNVICNVTMRVDETEIKEYAEASSGLMDLDIKRYFSLLKKLKLYYRFTSDFKRQQRYEKMVDEFYEGVLAKRTKDIASEEESAKTGAVVDDLLNLRGEDAFTHEEVRGEMQALITAGSETIGTALNFLLFELAKLPDAQRKILEETSQVLGPNKEADVAFDDVHRLKYTESVVKEALRMYPPAHLFPKRMSEDVKFGEMTIPAGADVLLYMGALHMSPDYYPNPEKFLPERFLSDDNYPFMPFGVGPKMCLGHKLAMLEAKVIVAKLVRNFEFSPVQPEYRIVLKLEGILKSANGVPVILKLRE